MRYCDQNEDIESLAFVGDSQTVKNVFNGSE